MQKLIPIQWKMPEAFAKPSNSEEYQLNDKWVRILGVPGVALLMVTIFNYQSWPHLPKDIVLVLFSALLTTYMLWEGNRIVILLVKRRFPAFQQTAYRLIIQVLVCILYTIVGTYVIDLFLLFAFNFALCSEHGFFFELLVNLAPVLFVVSLYESAYFFGEWKKNILRSESLALESVQSQLEALKNQIDPHFLFNSLNTLASLITEDNEPAQKYLEQLSDVYRYVLQSKHQTTVALTEEVTFLDSYVYLNRTRFRDNLMVRNEIPAHIYHYHIAPLSLQMLIENAIKHNIISKDKPLVIRILYQNGHLTIENNVQKKTILLDKSTKIGLQNIINRYRLLSNQTVEVIQSEDWFTVHLPLLKPLTT